MKWINVKEKLPEFGEPVLVWHPSILTCYKLKIATLEDYVVVHKKDGNEITGTTFISTQDEEDEMYIEWWMPIDGILAIGPEYDPEFDD